MMAKRFPSIDIAQVDFNRGDGHCGDRISKGDAGVGIGSGVDQDALMMIKGSVDSINQGSFVVGLEESNFDLKGLGFRLQGTINVIQRRCAIDTGFALAEEI